MPLFVPWSFFFIFFIFCCYLLFLYHYVSSYPPLNIIIISHVSLVPRLTSTSPNTSPTRSFSTSSSQTPTSGAMSFCRCWFWPSTSPPTSSSSSELCGSSGLHGTYLLSSCFCGQSLFIKFLLCEKLVLCIYLFIAYRAWAILVWFLLHIFICPVFFKLPHIFCLHCNYVKRRNEVLKRCNWQM